MTIGDTDCEHLSRRAGKLASGATSLAASFEEEATRLKRKDEASRLIALRSSISQQLEQAKSLEIAASYGHTKAKLITSLAELAVGIGIRMASEDKRALAVSDHLLKNLGGKERPFGTVIISIGPKGVPDEVQVVSVSELARESKREESEIINRLRQCGHLLLSEKAFSFLMDKLIRAVQEGRFLLPIPVEKLSEVNASASLMLEAKKSQWVLHSQQP